jgi:integrase
MKFTSSSVAQLTLPQGVAERIYFDDDVSGFGLRLRKGGNRSWVVQYKIGSQNRRMTLGSISTLDLGKARSNAKHVLARVRLGQDPQADKAQARVAAGETFDRYLDEYLDWKQPQVRPASYREITRYLRKHAAPWHLRQLATITQRDAADLIDALTEKHGAPTANRARAALSPYFGWLLSKGRINNNPLAFTPKAVENGSRERVLSDAELAAIWRTCCDDQFGTIVRLLMLTAARRTEIGGLSWSEYRDGMIVIPEQRSKNGREHEIRLSALAREILDSQVRRNSTEFIFGRLDTQFSGWSKAKADLDARLAATGIITVPWSLHDIRRTVATNLADRLRVEPHIIEAILGHVSGHKSGVAGVYNRAAYREQKAEALQRWADLVKIIISNSDRPERSHRPGLSSSNRGVSHGRKLVETAQA